MCESLLYSTIFFSFSGREHRRDEQRAGAIVLGVPHGSVPVQLGKRVRNLGQASLHVCEVGEEPAGVLQSALQRPGETFIRASHLYCNLGDIIEDYIIL